ncbi:MAG: hypothetical protein LBK61_05270 [Spirochaetaceae bacterium]|nr:hypothetical protein [Spirochaetaceae bacterium]
MSDARIYNIRASGKKHIHVCTPQIVGPVGSADNGGNHFQISFSSCARRFGRFVFDLRFFENSGDLFGAGILDCDLFTGAMEDKDIHRFVVVALEGFETAEFPENNHTG